MSQGGRITHHYSRHSLADALVEVGLGSGQVVFCHSNIGLLGRPAEGSDPQTIFQVILGAFQDVLGKNGTLVVPTFTYSFPRMQPFDPDNTPSTCGIFSEMIRKHADARRSLDPVFSVAAVGGQARELTANVSENCFGPDSFFDRFHASNGMVCNLNLDAGSTYLHYVERQLLVPYRYDKVVSGLFCLQGEEKPGRAIIYVRDLCNPCTEFSFKPFDKLATQVGVAKKAKAGLGVVVASSAQASFELIGRTLPERPMLLTISDGQEVVLDFRPKTDYGISLGKDQPTDQQKLFKLLTDQLAPLQRQGVTGGVDTTFAILGDLLPLELSYLPTGSPLGNTLIPERWVATGGWIRSTQGDIHLNLQDYPHLVVAHSRPFSGKVGKNLLEEHRFPMDATLLDKNNWGIHLPDTMTLPDNEYEVSLQVEQCFGALTCGRWHKSGQEKDAPPVLLAIDLGEGSSTPLVAMVLVLRDLAGWQPRCHWTILFYPKPFAPQDLRLANDPDPMELTQLMPKGQPTVVNACEWVATLKNAMIDWDNHYQVIASKAKGSLQ
ncbi:MAG: hypothetical protein G8345_13490 [Magnetococcales bacterium]|nr:AAC(3) family N-acetyltransferase [Magnetococcales bacterium]NGZ27888.1 hypothetical protein [Magnetococcales bacterium]